MVIVSTKERKMVRIVDQEVQVTTESRGFGLAIAVHVDGKLFWESPAKADFSKEFFAIGREMFKIMRSFPEEMDLESEFQNQLELLPGKSKA